MMKILITGSTGYVGQILLPKLIDLKYKIFEVTIEPEKSKSLYADKTQQFYFSDNTLIKLSSEVEKFGPDVVIHLASYLTSSDKYNDMIRLLDANINFTCTILDSLKNSKIKLFINTGSMAEYFKGNGKLDPAYLYAATKSASRVFVDYYSKVYNFKYITVIPYTIYGKNFNQKKIIDIIYDSFYSNDPLELTEGNQLLDFIHVDDVTDFYLLLLKKINSFKNGDVFHLGTGRGHSLREIENIMSKIIKKKPNIKWGAKKYRYRDVMYAVANISKQYRKFGWKAKINIEDGIRKMIQRKENNV